MQAHPGGNLKFRPIDNVTFIVGGLRIMGVARRASTVQVSYMCVCVCVCVCTIYIYIYTFIYIYMYIYNIYIYIRSAEF